MKKAVVAMVCLLCVLFSSFPVLAQSATELEDELLGTVSAQYESNGDPGVISGGEGDLGGASYGAYQFASQYNIPHTFAKWCVSSQKGAEIGNALLYAYELDKNTLGENFNKTWKQIANDRKDEFLKLQRLYVKTKYYDPAVSALQANCNLDVSLYGIAFKNAVWSRTLQHGLGSYTNQSGFLGIMRQLELATPGGLASLSEEGLITAIYEESGKVVSQGTNPMTAATAGGNAWIIRSYNLEGKFMKYYSGNSAAVQAGVYLRLRVKELAALLEMLATYGGYLGEENGKRTPYLKNNRLILTECDSVQGVYGSSNVALSVSDISAKEGSGALNFLPLSVEYEISFVIKCKSLVDYSSFSTLQFYLYLPGVVFDDSAALKVFGVVDNQKSQLASCTLSSLKEGWQKVTFTVPKGFSAQWLSFEFSGLPEGVVGERFMIDDLCVVSAKESFETYKVVADALHCRTGPDSSFDSMGLYPQNTMVTVLAKQNGWYLCTAIVDGKVLFGWSNGGYLQQVTPNGLLGDLDGNGKVAAVDALQILQHAVGKRTLTAIQKSLGDLNGDGLVNAKDALQVLRIAVNKV